VRLLQEQEIRSEHQTHNTTEIQQYIFINNAGVGAIPPTSRVHGGVARQQQPHDFNVTIINGQM
jgi:hypothetical protein